MTQLTTDIISHYIITVQGNHYPITADKEKKLQLASGSDMFLTQSGVQIKVSNIAEIIPVSEYKFQYPEKNYGQSYKDLPTKTWEELMTTSERGLEIMIAGWEKTLRTHKCDKFHNECQIESLLRLAKSKQNVTKTTNPTIA